MFCIDETLTVDNVTSVVLRTSKGWYGALADSMAIPWTIQEKIMESHSTADKQTRAMVNYWVNTLHDASWTTLAGVLYQREEDSALQKALRYCTRTRGNRHLLISHAHQAHTI